MTPAEVRESWRIVARRGLFPQLSDTELRCLRDALARDEPALIQGRTMQRGVWSGNVFGACAIAYPLWRDRGIEDAGELESAWASVCADIGEAVKETAGSMWFINWWDVTPRADAVPALLAEVEAEMARRAGESLPCYREDCTGTVAGTECLACGSSQPAY